MFEEDVYRPSDPGLHEDQLEQYSLKSCTVYSTNTGQIASLLTADDTHPLTVRGIVEPVEEDQVKFLKLKNYTREIEIRNVTTFSYGEYQGGDGYGLWALGKAGWHLIAPSAAYENIYKDMIEAVSVWYFIQDFYSRVRKKPAVKTTTFEEMIVKYGASATPNLSRDEVTQRLQKHSSFLIKSISKKSATHSWWKRTGIFRYLNSDPSMFNADAPTIATLHNLPTRAAINQTKRKNLAQKQQPRPFMPGEHVDLTLETESDEDVSTGTIRRKRKGGLRTLPAPQKGPLKEQPSLTSAPLVDAEDTDMIDPGTHLDVEISSKRAAMSDQTSPAPKRPRDRTQTPPKLVRYDNGMAHAKMLAYRPLPLHVAQESLPTFEPQKDDIWSCTQDGCVHKVYSASSPDGQTSARLHYKEHISVTEIKEQERIELVKAEAGHYLPMNNLIDRIRAMAHRSETHPEFETVTQLKPSFPRPVRRRL